MIQFSAPGVLVGNVECESPRAPGIPRTERTEQRIARTGPPLPETLRMLAPLAPTLEVLDFSFNPLGGTITTDIMTFTKLTKLMLVDMGLEGASRGLSSAYTKRTGTERK